MKKILPLALALLMLICLSACGNGAGSENKETTLSPEATEADQPSDAGSTQDAPSQNGAPVAPAKLTGKLELIELDDRDPSVLRGLRITGNNVGTADDINGKASSLTDVRCVFELNEWIEFYPDTDEGNTFRVWILSHRDDQAYYETCEFSELMPGFASCCDLTYPADMDAADEWYWGSFYLNPDENETGYYDFVFTCEGKAIAVLQTRFYNDGELRDKSGAELEALMHE